MEASLLHPVWPNLFGFVCATLSPSSWPPASLPSASSTEYYDLVLLWSKMSMRVHHGSQCGLTCPIRPPRLNYPTSLCLDIIPPLLFSCICINSSVYLSTKHCFWPWKVYLSKMNTFHSSECVVSFFILAHFPFLWPIDQGGNPGAEIRIK